ncbi:MULTISPECIES: 16S rRNA (cytosine(1402)-N(4))-methyltransferase RsmH [Pseudanabaena]|uniref:Ribosomal RNA small subunit methyltransferase H n=2 Tax=Pseudanabaena TaxID=1152 RepID=L8MV83_9CYAN|nr:MULTISPECIES: 16S rRNA (cytosine(1402)-N(4))-methyltransferase RsmH [Pseudanabaena]ELS31852.1 Ribosomal RNA small subunit methyltransferase H [Pseudanabaena biceps PCC 7429]MDG3495901.1 16S rRNA (cytosine(1402)-N(4))-methyltransferase RsmH [Pseudanabaena catenata USMAC16]
MTAQFHHVPVLAEPTIAGLAITSGGIYLDCTVGGGGHSSLILQAAENVRLVGIDRDEMAIAAASEKLQDYQNQVSFWRGNFCEYQPAADLQFDGILADLGVSSTQFDVAERGFSFREAGDLDMRMDNRQTLTAAEIVNHYQEVELADIFFKLGEERLSRRIARQIVEKRPFKTTLELANAISACVPSSYRHGRIHPATRTFQALRIAVNRELESLEKWLAVAPNWLKVGGKIVVITFHSLEDRIVKHTFREDDRLQVITKKVIIATDEENRANPRARSAKLRIAQRVE